MRRSFSFPVRVLLLGRGGTGLPLALTPPAAAVAPGGSIAFSAAPGQGAGGLQVAPSALTVAAGNTQTFAAKAGS